MAASLATARAMHMRNLGQSSLRVSEACLGTMTWGVQNDQRDADAQIDLAREHGVNFIDTAEMYPVPTFADQWRAGATEEILGDYLDRHKAARDELVIATKVTGYMPRSAVAAARTTPPTSPAPDCRLDAASVKAACDASLRRLKTDRVDLLQLHWPDRYVPLFGDTVYQHKKRDDEVPIEETAEALRDLADAGKIRAFGLSNETPFGVARWHQACEALGTSDGLASIQNSYSLVDRLSYLDWGLRTEDEVVGVRAARERTHTHKQPPPRLRRAPPPAPAPRPPPPPRVRARKLLSIHRSGRQASGTACLPESEPQMVS